MRASDLGAAIRELRKRRRVTIARLAVESGVDAATISAIEHGRDMADVGDRCHTYVTARHVLAVVAALGGELRLYVPAETKERG